MTYEEFFENYFIDEADNIIQDMYWTDSYSSDKLHNQMLKYADELNIKVEHIDDYDAFWWDLYNSIEKGLS